MLLLDNRDNSGESYETSRDQFGGIQASAFEEGDRFAGLEEPIQATCPDQAAQKQADWRQEWHFVEMG